MMRYALILLMILVALPASSAPPLSDEDRQRLIDGTTERNDVLDQEDGFYVLLRNADPSKWARDDFGGDAGAAVAPPPDYEFLKATPEQARGNVYTIEGWLVYADRWPTLVNHSSDNLLRAGDPAWGGQTTRWTLVTEKDNADATIIVIFNDPDAALEAPEVGSKVRIAARFHKVWTIPDTNGQPFSYVTFVGGAAETIEDTAAAATSGGPGSRLSIVLGAVLVIGGFFVGMRILMKRVATGGGGGTMLQDRLDEMRREREADEAQGGADEEDTSDLPEDPVAALDALRQKHETAD